MKRAFILALVACSAATFAQNAYYTGTLSASDPTFNRPLTGTPPTGLSGVGTAVFYNVQPFYVSVTGTYTIETTAPTPNAFDTFIVVYGNAFNPASPLTNALGAQDDFTGSFTVLPGPYSAAAGPGTGSGGASPASRMDTLSFTAGAQYYLVNTTYSNGLTGTFYTGIGGGQGTVSLGVVPEPASLAVLGIGALALLRRRRKA